MVCCWIALEPTATVDELTIYMPKRGNDVKRETDYKDGEDDPFEFLLNNGDYSVTPIPEAATTLFTNYNIRTSGIVIGENIESHVFQLNIQ